MASLPCFWCAFVPFLVAVFVVCCASGGGVCGLLVGFVCVGAGVGFWWLLLVHIDIKKTLINEGFLCVAVVLFLLVEKYLFAYYVRYHIDNTFRI